MTNQQLPKPLVNLLDKHLLKIELVLIIIIAVGYILKLSSVEYGNLVFNIGLILLPTIYFLSGFISPEGTGMLVIIGRKVIFISYAVVLVGLYFTINQYPGAEKIINIGSITLLVALLIYLLGSFKKWQAKDMVILVRALILLTLVVMVSL